MKYKRGYIISVETGFFKKPIISITDGNQEIQFEICGTFVIETDSEISIPLIKPDINNLKVNKTIL